MSSFTTSEEKCELQFAHTIDFEGVTKLQKPLNMRDAPYQLKSFYFFVFWELYQSETTPYSTFKMSVVKNEESK